MVKFKNNYQEACKKFQRLKKKTARDRKSGHALTRCLLPPVPNLPLLLRGGNHRPTTSVSLCALTTQYKKKKHANDSFCGDLHLKQPAVFKSVFWNCCMACEHYFNFFFFLIQCVCLCVGGDDDGRRFGWRFGATIYLT